MEDNLNRRRPKLKATSKEDDLKGRRPKMQYDLLSKMTSMQDELNGRQRYKKITKEEGLTWDMAPEVKAYYVKGFNPSKKIYI